jgi:hypothetical protein
MTREQAINYLFSSGFTNEQVCEVVRALTYEPTTKNDLGVDLISRADAIQAMQDKAKKLTNEDTINGLCGAVAMLYEMPSVTPQPCDTCRHYENSCHWLPSVTPQEPRKGHWLRRPHVYGVTYCSVCDFELKIDNTNYCPNCGADMREVEE